MHGQVLTHNLEKLVFRNLNEAVAHERDGASIGDCITELVDGWHLECAMIWPAYTLVKRWGYDTQRKTLTQTALYVLLHRKSPPRRVFIRDGVHVDMLLSGLPDDWHSLECLAEVKIFTLQRGEWEENKENELEALLCFAMKAWERH